MRRRAGRERLNRDKRGCDTPTAGHIGRSALLDLTVVDGFEMTHAVAEGVEGVLIDC
jgi:hypothetical protein